MSCKQWNDEWVARLYGELDPAHAAACDEHLAQCAACRATLDQLASARSALRECEDEVPAAPRLLLLQPRRTRHLAWTFAAGVACALAAFTVGLYAAPHLGRSATAAAEPAIDAQQNLAAVTSEVDRLTELQRAIEQRLVSLEGRPDTATELKRFEARLASEREQDLRAVLRSITAAEQRTGTWMHETRAAMQTLALRQDPRMLER